MARPRTELQTMLESMTGVAKVYFQPPSLIQDPCIIYEFAANDHVDHANNSVYSEFRRYDVIVVDRNPDSLIPRQVGSLPHARFDRFYRTAGLNHFVYELFF